MKPNKLFNFLIVAATLSSASVFAARTACVDAGGHNYTLLQVASASAAYPGDVNNAEQIIEVPKATTMSVTTGTGKCGSVEGGSGADSNYSTSATYYMRGNLHSADRIGAFFATVYLQGTADNIGTLYSNVEKVGTTTCSETINGVTTYFWKQCVAP